MKTIKELLALILILMGVVVFFVLLVPLFSNPTSIADDGGEDFSILADVNLGWKGAAGTLADGEATLSIIYPEFAASNDLEAVFDSPWTKPATSDYNTTDWAYIEDGPIASYVDVAIDWEGGSVILHTGEDTLRISGDLDKMDEPARVFFEEYLKPSVDSYIEEHCGETLTFYIPRGMTVVIEENCGSDLNSD